MSANSDVQMNQDQVGQVQTLPLANMSHHHQTCLTTLEHTLLLIASHCKDHRSSSNFPIVPHKVWYPIGSALGLNSSWFALIYHLLP